MTKIYYLWNGIGKIKKVFTYLKRYLKIVICKYKNNRGKMNYSEEKIVKIKIEVTENDRLKNLLKNHGILYSNSK